MKRLNNDEFYASYYQKIMRGGVIGNVVNRYHQELELPFRSTDFFSSVIELGAGSCEHLPFVKHRFGSYILSDIRTKNLLESTSEIINSEIQLDTPTYVSHYKGQITVSKIDAQNLKKFKDNRFDRLVAGCLILHLEKPENALREWKRVVKKGGSLSIYIHCEPGLLLRYLRIASTALRGRSLKIDHLSCVYSEHKISFIAIKYLINKVFEGDEIKFKAFPFKYLSWNFNLWKTVQIKLNT
jgi:SAM-dependent methyltransferase